MLKIMIFSIGNNKYAINLSLVNNILRINSLTMTKNRNKFIIDDKVIEAYKLSSLFNEAQLSLDHTNQRVILVQDKTVLIALIVDDTGGVISINPESTIKLPPVFKGTPSSCFSGAFKHEGTLVLLINPLEIQKTAASKIE